MAFFQNLFNQEFRGNWVIGDRQYSLTFVCPANRNTSDYQVAYNNGPWDFSSANTLTLNYLLDENLKNFSSLSINVNGANPSETTVNEVVQALNSNSIFSELFLAESYTISGGNTVFIKTKVDSSKRKIKLWISNTGAEEKFRFNKHAGIAELPSYFERHTIENWKNFPDSVGQLILLDETDLNVDAKVIEDSGFVISDMQEDWQLIAGRASGTFTFQKLTVDGSNRITQIIEYPAGSKEGAFSRKINYIYSGSNTNPSEITQIPYVLKSGDLVSPP